MQHKYWTFWPSRTVLRSCAAQFSTSIWLRGHRKQKLVEPISIESTVLHILKWKISREKSHNTHVLCFPQTAKMRQPLCQIDVLPLASDDAKGQWHPIPNHEPSRRDKKRQYNSCRPPIVVHSHEHDFIGAMKYLHVHYIPCNFCSQTIGDESNLLHRKNILPIQVMKTPQMKI